MAYVYRHIRLDKHETFYVGIGLGRDGKHSRAYNFSARTDFWKKVFNKTEIQVEIIHDNVDYEEAKRLEIYYISIFKRRCDGGSLVNMTLGGDGTVGSTRPNLVHLNKTKPRAGIHNANYKGPIYAYRNNQLIGTFVQIGDLEKVTGIPKHLLLIRISRKQITKGIYYTRKKL